MAGQLPARVVTARRTEDGAGTDLADLDGYDGTVRIDLTVQDLTVQWANILQVPDLDISVQPGLVTDPSMGALVDSAFNPATSHELELQRRTIDLIGDVNGVLARASSTISDVRRILSGSAAPSTPTPSGARPAPVRCWVPPAT